MYLYAYYLSFGSFPFQFFEFTMLLGNTTFYYNQWFAGEGTEQAAFFLRYRT